MSSERICGVDREVLEEFLKVLKDCYPQADKANYFLEINEGESGIGIAITNQRDALSHFVTCLQSDNATPSEQRDQLTNALEHLRRAALEPYERAVSARTEKVRALYERYKAEVLSRPEIETIIPGVMTLAEIDTKFAAIARLREGGRAAKTINAWTPRWEAGVAQFIEAYECLTVLSQVFEDHIVRAAQQAQTGRFQRQGLIHTAGWSVASILVGILLTVAYPHRDHLWTDMTAIGKWAYTGGKSPLPHRTFQPGTTGAASH